MNWTIAALQNFISQFMRKALPFVFVSPKIGWLGFTTIQSAIQYVENMDEKKMIFVGPGTYYENEIAWTGDRMVMFGCGRATIIDGGSTAVTAVLQVDGDENMIAFMTAQSDAGAGKNNRCFKSNGDKNTFLGCSVIEADSAGFCAAGDDNLFVACRVDQADYFGLFAEPGTGNVFIANMCGDPGAYGLYTSGDNTLFVGNGTLGGTNNSLNLSAGANNSCMVGNIGGGALIVDSTNDSTSEGNESY